jgi:UDPglucose 6-dehydrogenase
MSGKTCGVDFGLCYGPTFVALGQVIDDFLNPSFGLVGEFDEPSGNLLVACYQRLFRNGAPVRRMAIENAELAKLAVNSFITTKIAFANMVGDICERLPSGDAAIVLDAVGADPRIGAGSLKVGLGFGGPCFPRDNRALDHLAHDLGVSAAISRATHEENRNRPGRLLDRLPFERLIGIRVAVLGLAYKPGSPVVEGSQSIDLANELVVRGADVTAYDSQAGPEARAALSPKVPVLADLESCISGAQVVIVAQPEPTYLNAVKQRAETTAEPLWVYDIWNVIGPQRNPMVTLIVPGLEAHPVSGIGVRAGWTQEWLSLTQVGRTEQLRE